MPLTWRPVGWSILRTRETGAPGDRAEKGGTGRFSAPRGAREVRGGRARGVFVFVLVVGWGDEEEGLGPPRGGRCWRLRPGIGVGLGAGSGWVLLCVVVCLSVVLLFEVGKGVRIGRGCLLW